MTLFIHISIKKDKILLISFVYRQTSWTDQLDRPVFFTWSLGQFAYSMIDLSVCTLSQIPSLTQALFILWVDISYAFMWNGFNIFDMSYIIRWYDSITSCLRWEESLTNQKPDVPTNQKRGQVEQVPRIQTSRILVTIKKNKEYPVEFHYQIFIFTIPFLFYDLKRCFLIVCCCSFRSVVKLPISLNFASLYQRLKNIPTHRDSKWS